MTRDMPRHFRIAISGGRNSTTMLSKVEIYWRLPLKVGDVILPLNIRIVSKQGRGNTDKPTCFRTMIKEVLDVFDAEGVDLRKYPIPFDSWYGSKDLIEALSEFGFTCILIHGKSNYCHVNHFLMDKVFLV